MSASPWPYPSYSDRLWLGGEGGQDRALAALVTAVRRTSAESGSAQSSEDRETVLAALGHLSAIAERVDWALLSLVGEARANGASWAAVGAALGVSRQAAQQRFAPWVTEAIRRRQSPPERSSVSPSAEGSVH